MVAYAWEVSGALEEFVVTMRVERVYIMVKFYNVNVTSAKCKSVKKVFIGPLANIYGKLTKYFAEVSDIIVFANAVKRVIFVVWYARSTILRSKQ